MGSLIGFEYIKKKEKEKTLLAIGLEIQRMFRQGRMLKRSKTSLGRSTFPREDRIDLYL